jgi:putative flippase GtrA
VVAPFPRLTRWALVAVFGFGVQTAVLLLLVHAAGLHYLPALALAVTSAIVHNFVWHERWTWADRPAARAGTRVARFVRFTSVAALVSLAGGVALAALLIEWLHVPLAIANLATVLVLGLLNFAGADRLAFIPERQAHVGRQPAHLDVRGDPTDDRIAATSLAHDVPLITRDRRLRRSKKVPLARPA